MSTSIHGTRKKNEIKPRGTRDKSVSNNRPGEKEKMIGQKERKGLPRPTPWKNQGIRSQLVKRKLKPSVNPAMLQLQ